MTGYVVDASVAAKWLVTEAFSDEAARLLDLMSAAIAGREGLLPREDEDGAIHARLARAWRAPHAQWDVIRRALVLLADHELNASTFAARVAASTGASLAASVLAGLSALSGPFHGRMAERDVQVHLVP